MKPQEIEGRSMAIIDHEMRQRGLTGWPPEELAVVKRCIHTSADFDYGENLVFSPGAVISGIEALKSGVTIVTDTNMAAAGINKKAAEQLGVKVKCFMADEDVAEEAKQRQITRAAVSMEKAIALRQPLIIACGNAPTALLRLKEIADEGQISKGQLQLLIGVPVGFVNVVEAKEEILKLDVPYIVARGRKGGSNIAAAICNALLYQCVRR